MDETPPEVTPIKRRRRKKSVVAQRPNEREAGTVRPKRDRKLTGPNPNREIIKTMRRLKIATSGLGPSAPEIFKASILQCVNRQLEQVAQMLSWITNGPQVNPVQKPYPPSMPPAEIGQVRQLTPEEADAQFLATHHAPKEPGQVCIWDGQPAVYVTKRGSALCIAHKKQGIEDDQAEVLANRLSLSGGMGNPEVIRVPQSVIDDALARGDGEGD